MPTQIARERARSVSRIMAASKTRRPVTGGYRGTGGLARSETALDKSINKREKQMFLTSEPQKAAQELCPQMDQTETSIKPETRTRVTKNKTGLTGIKIKELKTAEN